MPFDYKNEMDQLHPGDHLCLVYENYDDQVAALTTFLASGLQRGEQVFCIQHPHTNKHLQECLSAQGVNVAQALEKEALVFKTLTESYLPDGHFDKARMAQGLRESLEASRAQGFTCFRVTGDVTWTRKKCPGSEQLLEYEWMMDEFFPADRCIGMCTYHRKRFPEEELSKFMQAHRLTFQRDEAGMNCQIRIRTNNVFADVLPDRAPGSDLYHYIVQRDGSQKVLGWGQVPGLHQAKAEAEFLISQYAESIHAASAAFGGHRWQA